MEKLLIIGTNTRPLVNSALKLDFEVYSASYFKTKDFKEPHHERHILNQKPNKSCGKFEEKYSSDSLLELCSDWIDEVDYILPYTGFSAKLLPSKKILGTSKTSQIEDKYKLYKKLKKRKKIINDFKLPETIRLTEIDEGFEIAKQNHDKEYIIKPTSGSGGLFVEKLNNLTENQLNQYFQEDMILQEFIYGENISGSILSTKNESELISTSKQLFGNDCPGLNSGFMYCGNIVPFIDFNICNNENNDLNQIEAYNKIKNVSEEIANYLKLVGSNGIDIIINKGQLYVIEVNSRIQGTFECVEESYGLNMIHAHFQACKGKLIETPPLKKHSIKNIIYSKEKSIVIKELQNYDGIYDIPYPNVIIEKNQPVYTIITSHESLKKAKEISDLKIKLTQNTLKTL